MRDELHEAFILHGRNYRDTSLIVDLFTRQAGRVSMVVRGARGRKPRFRSALQPFVPLLASWYGKGELKTARGFECHKKHYLLKGERLFIGLYVNELLYRLAGRFDPMPGLFDHYEMLLARLEAPQADESELRRFEIRLLAELGYGLTFDYEAVTGEPVQAQKSYRFVPERGFSFSGVAEAEASYPGEHLLHIAGGRLQDPAVLQSAKQITRAAINERLGGRPIRSRELFMKVQARP